MLFTGSTRLILKKKIDCQSALIQAGYGEEITSIITFEKMSIKNKQIQYWLSNFDGFK